MIVDLPDTTTSKIFTRLMSLREQGGLIVLRGSGELSGENESLVSALLLPDAPIVAWWPHGAPRNAGATSTGRMAHRRITDSANEKDP
jgi:glucose-6-phosphate dehydrogenase assembly protein OpcA